MVTQNFQPNPYIVGNPVNDPSKFFGRDDLFGFIADNLKQGVKVILLHGQRRIGKSSVLFQIPNLVFRNDDHDQNNFVFVFFDLQNKNNLPLDRILEQLVKKILSDKLIQPSITNKQEELNNIINNINRDYTIFLNQFLPLLYQCLGNKNLVLLLDEFDVVNEEESIEKKGNGFFEFLQKVVYQQDKLFIIPVVGRHISVSEMPKLRNLFNSPHRNIGLLSDQETQELITKPAEGILEYSEDAIKTIYELSSGHPYCTQAICSVLYVKACQECQRKITLQDVKDPAILDRILGEVDGGLDWFWKGISMPAQVVFLAAANAEISESPFTVLEKNGVVITEDLIEAAQTLVEKNVLEKRTPNYTDSKIKIELVRLWLLKKYHLGNEIKQLEIIAQEEVQDLRRAAERLLTKTAFKEQEGNKNKIQALNLYESILQLNPNHFDTILDMARLYSQLGNTNKALEFYTRAYRFDPLRHTDDLVAQLEQYAYQLFEQKDYTKAKQQYEEVLKIQPESREAQQGLKVIEHIQSQFTWRCEGYKDASHPFQLVNINQNCPLCRRTRESSEYSINHNQSNSNSSKVIKFNPIPLGRLRKIGAVLIVLVAGSLGIYQVSKPCSPGQSKEFGIVCADHKINLISRGERTLFPTILNPNRDQGIVAYKKGNYTAASEFFKSAVASNQNDPEVLIYYNNALARSKGIPITLAVVVPVDNAVSKAQEILRGVAQAQNQFNNNNGLNGRLLEIVIANDGNYDKDKQGETAKQVAEELVKDSNILGVVGHNSSDSTLAALPLYEEGKLPVISPGSTSIYISNKIFFRTVTTDAASGEKLAEYAIKSGLKKVVVFSNIDSKYSNSLRESFEKKFEKQGGEIINPKPIELEANPQLDGGNAVSISIFKYQAQAAALFPDANHIIPQSLEIASKNASIRANRPNSQQLGLKLLGGDTLYSNDVLTQGKKDVEGMVLAVPWFRESPQSQKFAQAAAKQWGRPVAWRTATSFDATQAFIQTFKGLSLNLSRETVLLALRQVNISATSLSIDVLTSGDNIKFEADNERQIEPVLVQVKDGEFTLLQ